MGSGRTEETESVLGKEVWRGFPVDLLVGEKQRHLPVKAFEMILVRHGTLCVVASIDVPDNNLLLRAQTVLIDTVPDLPRKA